MCVRVNIDHVAPSDHTLHNRHEMAHNFIDCPANVLILRYRLAVYTSPLTFTSFTINMTMKQLEQAAINKQLEPFSF